MKLFLTQNPSHASFMQNLLTHIAFLSSLTPIEAVTQRDGLQRDN